VCACGRRSECDGAAVAAWASETAAAAAAAAAAAGASAAAPTPAPPPPDAPAVAWRLARIAPLSHLLPAALLSSAAPLRLALAPGAPPATRALLSGWASLSEADVPIAMAVRPVAPVGPHPQPELIMWHAAGGACASCMSECAKSTRLMRALLLRIRA
jgi:hypothetical protein